LKRKEDSEDSHDLKPIFGFESVMTLGERNGQALKGNVPKNIPIKITVNFEFVHGRLDPHDKRLKQIHSE
jgi:hypothetical protein